MCTSVLVLRCIHNVTDNSGSSSKLTGALSVEHGITYGITCDHDGIKYTVCAGKRMLFRNKMRSHIGERTVLAVFKYGQKFD